MSIDVFFLSASFQVLFGYKIWAPGNHFPDRIEHKFGMFDVLGVDVAEIKSTFIQVFPLRNFFIM